MTNEVDSPSVARDFARLRIWYRSVGSTMDVATELGMAGAPHGTVVEAAYQSAGRGRMGRGWDAPPRSALLTSWILRVGAAPADAGVLSPLVALAVIRTIEALIPELAAGYKWPNDVLVDGRKVSGILLTSRGTNDGVMVVAGIGVNLDAWAGDAAPDRAGLGAWRSDLSPRAVREQLASELARVWQRFLDRGELGDCDRVELEQRLRWRGERVEIQLPDREVTGTIVGLGGDGSLRLRLTGGDRVETLRMGEILRGPRESGAGPHDLCRILPDASRATDACPNDRERH